MIATSAPANDGAILLTAISGGITPYTFLWSTGATTESLANIPAGEYSLSVTDAAGCVWVFSYTVSVETAVVALGRSPFKALIVPNPTFGASRLWLDASVDQSLNICILDVSGRILHRIDQDFSAGKNAWPMPEDLLPGLYWVQLTDEVGNRKVIAWVVSGSYR